MEQSLTETLNVLISEKYLNENDVDGIFSNQKVMDLIHKEESPSDKGYNSNNCHARVWKNGFDNIQCNCLKMDGEDYCLTHCKRVKEVCLCIFQQLFYFFQRKSTKDYLGTFSDF